MTTEQLTKIKEDFNKVIQHSQNIENPKTDELFKRWLEAKRDFIELFRGELIYEYPETVSFELGPKERHDRIMGLTAMIECEYENFELASFIEAQEEGFFNNITVKDFETYQGKMIKAGTKLVKAFKYFVSNERSLTDIQNEASRIIQEDKIEGTLCLSVHPLDYLSLSENNHNWRSCHALDGEYRAGNLSYMMDQSTLVCYLKASETARLPRFHPDVEWNSKKWRVLLFMSNDWRMMFAGRQYPFEASSGMDFVLRHLLPSCGLCRSDGSYGWSGWNDVRFETADLKNDINIAFDSAYVPVGRQLVALNELIEDVKGSKHYNDLLYSSCYKPIYTVKYWDNFWHGGTLITKKEETKFFIGSYTYCLQCGKAEVIGGADSMMCEDCELQYGNSDSDMFTYCSCCDSRIFADDAYYVGGETLCQGCYESSCLVCENCGETMFKENIRYHEDSDRYLCKYCYNEIVEE